MAVGALMILVLTEALATVAIAYEGFAGPRGWPVGKWFAQSDSWLKVTAFLGSILVLWKAWFLFGWWAVPGVLIAGFFGGAAATFMLGPRVQPAVVILLPVGLLSTLLLGARIGSS